MARAKEASTVVWTTSSLSFRKEGKSSLKSTQTRAKTGCLVETSYKTCALTFHLAADFRTGSLLTPTPLPLFPDNPRTEGEAPTSLMTFPTPYLVGVCTCDDPQFTRLSTGRKSSLSVVPELLHLCLKK